MIALGILSGSGLLAWWMLRARPLELANQRLISTADAAYRAPSFSPDGTTIAAVVPDASGVPQIRVINLGQGTSLQITTGTAAASRPRWSPKGDLIVFAVADQGIWSVSPLGGEPRRILANGFNPNFSRDGSRLVFEESRRSLDGRVGRRRHAKGGRLRYRSPIRWRADRHFRRMDLRSRSSRRKRDRTATCGSSRRRGARRAGSRRTCAKGAGPSGRLTAGRSSTHRRAAAAGRCGRCRPPEARRFRSRWAPVRTTSPTSAPTAKRLRIPTSEMRGTSASRISQPARSDRSCDAAPNCCSPSSRRTAGVSCCSAAPTTRSPFSRSMWTVPACAR